MDTYDIMSVLTRHLVIFPFQVSYLFHSPVLSTTLVNVKEEVLTNADYVRVIVTVTLIVKATLYVFLEVDLKL